jgi:iron complex outermembrane receptor protein
MSHPTPFAPPRALRRLFVAALCILSSAGVDALWAQDSAKRRFDVPAGAAEAALKQFSEQSGRGLLISTDTARGVRTNAVSGDFTAREALEQMLVDTGLVAAQDPKNGAFVVRREPPAPSAKNVPSPAAADPAAPGQIVRMDEFEVTGLRITGIVNQGVISREENQAVRYEIFHRADLERTGQTDLAEFFRQSNFQQGIGTGSQVSAANFGQSVGTGFANQTGDTLNLRGLGTGSTAVLINGRRLLSSGAAGTDVSRIPLSAVERIEILPASAGAIYGANAVGGVINVVLRGGFSGTELSSYFGGATRGGAEEQSYSLFAGRSFNAGRTHFNVTVNFRDFAKLRMGDRDFLEQGFRRTMANPVTNPMVGTARFFATFMGPLATGRATVRAAAGLGIPGAPTVQYATVPAGTSAGGLTAAAFAATAGTTGAGTDGQYARKILRHGRTETNAVFAAEHAVFAERLGVYTELTWRRSHADYSGPNRQPSSNILATNRYNPFGRTVTVYWDSTDLPDDQQSSDKETLRGVVGFKGRLSLGAARALNWAVDASTDYNTDLQWQKNSAAGMFNALGQGIYNPFRDFTRLAPMSAEEAEKYFTVTWQDVNSRIDALNFRLNGDLFALWSGPARFSLVAERRRDATFSQQRSGPEGAYVTPGGPRASGVWVRRYYFGTGGEVTVPLLGERQRRRWLQSAEISLGARYDAEGDYPRAIPALAAAKLAFTPDIALRAAYAEGFTPPNTNDRTQARITQPRVGSSLALEDPLRPGQPMPDLVTQVLGGNPGLKPETSTTRDLGLVFSPRAVPDLLLNASYFRITKNNLIRSSGQQDFTTTARFFPEYILRSAPSAADTAAGRPGAANTFINIAVNVAHVFTDGMDYRLRYDLPKFSWGRLRWDSSYTATKRFDYRITPTSALTSSINAQRGTGFPIVKANRIRSMVEWTRDAWAASVTGTYGNSYETNVTAPSTYNPTGLGFNGATIRGAMSFDCQVSYRFAYGQRPAGWRQWLGGTKWTLGALNLLDESPAIINNPGSGFYDASFDPRLRFVYFSVRKSL